MDPFKSSQLGSVLIMCSMVLEMSRSRDEMALRGLDERIWTYCFRTERITHTVLTLKEPSQKTFNKELDWLLFKLA